jgi:pimeloyl-ACP methyl ester carboxylesterase
MNQFSSLTGHVMARRTLLGAAGVAALAAWTGCATSATPTPSASRNHPVPDAPMPTSSASVAPGPQEFGTLSSSATGLDHPWLIAYPPGAKRGDRLPVVVMLHGYGDTISTTQLHRYPEVLAATVAGGGTRFAIAAINGGNLFWQKVGSQDAGAMVASEFVPLLKKLGLNTKRLALSGWSMGGWGSLRLACEELHGKLRAVAAVSTPCYATFAELPGQGWMTAADFAANNFYTRPERLADLPIYLACGESDEFYPGNVAFADILANTAGVRTPVVNFGAGNHSHEYWQTVAPSQLRFLSQHL